MFQQALESDHVSKKKNQKKQQQPKTTGEILSTKKY